MLSTLKEKIVLWLVATACLSFLMTLGFVYYYINVVHTQKAFEKGTEFVSKVDSTIPKVNEGIKDAKETVKEARKVSKEVKKIQNSNFVVKTDLNLEKNIPLLLGGMKTTISSLYPVVDKIDKAYGFRLTQTESILNKNKEELPSLFERGKELINSPEAKEVLDSPKVKEVLETPKVQEVLKLGEELVISSEVKEVLNSDKKEIEKEVKEKKLKSILKLLPANTMKKMKEEKVNISKLNIEKVISQLEEQKEKNNSVAYVETEEGIFFDNNYDNVEIYNDENNKIENSSRGINFLSNREIENTETLTFAFANTGNRFFDLTLNN